MPDFLFEKKPELKYCFFINTEVTDRQTNIRKVPSEWELIASISSTAQ